MNKSQAEKAIDVIVATCECRPEEIGALKAFLIDVPEGINRILHEISMGIANSQEDWEKMLENLVEYSTEIDHLKNHLSEVSDSIHEITRRFGERVEKGSRSKR